MGADQTRETVISSDLTATAVELFRAAMLSAVHERGEFTVALSGGSTPLPLFRKLARQPDLPWRHTRVFWGDERFLPHAHPDSNYRNARATLLDRVPLEPDRVHPWPEPAPGIDLAAAAAAYAQTISSTLGPEGLFDLQLLGLGSDAHTASLYPGDPALHVTGLTATAQPAGIRYPRLTLTPGTLSRSRTVLFLVAGEHKRQALQATQACSEPHEDCPASFISALRRRIVLTDLQP